MSAAQSILAAFNQVVAGTRATMEAVPEDKLDWSPHEKSWTLGSLATHLANIPNWTMPTLAASEFDLAPAEGAPPPLEAISTKSALLKALDESSGAARAAIESSSDEDLAGPWTMLIAGEARFTLPKQVVLRSFILDHMIHHRAQLGVYLRLLDAPVPQVFGPTADYPDM